MDKKIWDLIKSRGKSTIKTQLISAMKFYGKSNDEIMSMGIIYTPSPILNVDDIINRAIKCGTYAKWRKIFPNDIKKSKEFHIYYKIIKIIGKSNIQTYDKSIIGVKDFIFKNNINTASDFRDAAPALYEYACKIKLIKELFVDARTITFLKSVDSLLLIKPVRVEVIYIPKSGGINKFKLIDKEFGNFAATLYNLKVSWGKGLSGHPKSAKQYLSKLHGKRVINVETKCEYANLMEAGNSVKVSRAAIGNAIKRGTLSGGFHWKYKESVRG